MYIEKVKIFSIILISLKLFIINHVFSLEISSSYHYLQGKNIIKVTLSSSYQLIIYLVSFINIELILHYFFGCKLC